MFKLEFLNLELELFLLGQKPEKIINKNRPNTFFFLLLFRFSFLFPSVLFPFLHVCQCGGLYAYEALGWCPEPLPPLLFSLIL